MRADLALIGFGHVARRFVSLLEERREVLAATCDLQCRVVSIVTRRHGAVWNPNGIDSGRAREIVDAGESLIGFCRDGGSQVADGLEAIRRLGSSDAPLRIVIETTTLDIRNGQPAIDHAIAAFDHGCHVVTANKGPVAFAYDDLRQRAAAAGVSFLFEGAVMDGVPIFSLVRETLPVVNVSGFRGVVNSTTNHILSALEDGEAYAPALARMQAEGIAEADPSLDVDGWDAAAKAAALANMLMDARTTPHDVDRTGISPEIGPRAVEAKRNGRRLRLVASAQRNDDRVTVVVRPEELPQEDLLAGLRGMANALVLQTDLLGEIAICQLAGGLTQTAYALLSDIISVRRCRRSPHEERARRSL